MGLLLPNAFGLYDMNGNVWLWCKDYDQPVYSGSNEISPTGPLEPIEFPSQVCRYGDSSSSFNHCRSAARAGNLPGGGAAIEFRTVRTR